MLSPSQRQVAHALLTRPPLTFFRSKLQNQFVRLECVKHAASVHPEPGSNSRIKYFTVLGTAIYLFELDSLFLLFPWVSQFVIESCVLLWNLTSSLVRLSTFLALFSRLSLFNFQGTVSLPLFATAYIVYHTQFRLSRGFQNFFQVSFRHFRSLQVAISCFFSRSPCLPCLSGTGSLAELYYITTFFPFCQPLFALFSPFFCFFYPFFSTFRPFFLFFLGWGAELGSAPLSKFQSMVRGVDLSRYEFEKIFCIHNFMSADDISRNQVLPIGVGIRQKPWFWID